METLGNPDECSDLLQIDEIYEFSAPRYFDFVLGETEEEIYKTKKWFEASHNYAPSPFISRIKKSRSVEIDSNCDLEEAEEFHKKMPCDLQTEAATEIAGSNSLKDSPMVPEHSMPGFKSLCEDKLERIPKEADTSESSSSSPGAYFRNEDCTLTEVSTTKSTKFIMEACVMTPNGQIVSSRRGQAKNSCSHTIKDKPLPQKSCAATRLVKRTPMSQAKGIKGSTPRLVTTTGKNSVTVDIRQANQAIKRQKLELGKSRQILNVKEQILCHKSQVAVVVEKSSNTQMTKNCRKKWYELTTGKEINPTPFVSAAEVVKRFQSSTRDLDISHNRSLSHDNLSLTGYCKPALTLTQPKEPNFETSRRVKPVKVKSSSELEEEMLSNIPKFKARPLNRKILEGPTLLPLPRSIPQSMQFQEFHLKTMERASQHVESSSTETSQNEKPKSEHAKPHGFTVPRSPHLETSLRARPSNLKPSQELELEELANIPKFKARPLNNKIFENKSEVGVLRNQKHQITIPQEFHFAIDSRIPPMQPMVDLFDKLSINSKSREKQIPRLTVPDPFYLLTEERGTEKGKRLAEEIMHQQLEEQRARIRKANPYPYSTDYPEIPPKPRPKNCTKPEGFQLLSLIRHEEEIQKIMEERERAEKEASKMRIFKARPIMTSDPIAVPEKQRKPLTQVQEVVLHADHRAIERAEFEKKVKGKEATVKRDRDVYESVKMEEEEEEKAPKQMRRIMVAHARQQQNFPKPLVPERSSKQLTRLMSPSQRKLRAKNSVAAGTRMR